MNEIETRNTVKILIASIFVISMTSNAYAQESVDDTVQVPFEFLERLCGLNENGTKYICEWDPFANNGTDNDVINGTETSDSGSDIIVENKTNTDVDKILNHPDADLNQYQRDYLKFIKVPPTTNAQKDYFELLRELGTCQRGVGEARGVQEQSEFTVSVMKELDDLYYLRSLEYVGSHANLKKAVEECIAIVTTLKPVILGPEYIAKGNFFGSVQIYHGDVAKGSHDVIYDNEVTESEFLNEEAKALQKMCNSHLYPYEFKKQLGCFTIPEPVNGVVEMPFSDAYHKWYHYTITDHKINESFRPGAAGGEGPIQDFINRYGSVEAAIEAIKMKEHLNAKTFEESAEPLE